MIVIVSKRARAQQKKLALTHLVIDVTSTSDNATFRKFSPSCPHTPGIIVPGMPGVMSASVEGIWQGLKVFDKEGVDTSKFRVTNMKGLKRPANERRGQVQGHRFGDINVDYLSARKEIFIPSYTYKLDHYLQDELALLNGLLQEGNKLMLIDYETDSHAQLIKDTLLTWPTRHQD